MTDRIEEAKKILDDFFVECNECQLGEEPRIIGKYAPQICQLIPQPLDKELRGEIVATLRIWYGDHNVSRRMIDKLLALLQPKIEEARRQERERILKLLQGCYEVQKDGAWFWNPQYVRKVIDDLKGGE